MFWIGAELVIKKNPVRWVTVNGSEVKLLSLGPKPRFVLAGVILLLWVPRIAETVKYKELSQASLPKQEESSVGSPKQLLPSTKPVELEPNAQNEEKNISGKKSSHNSSTMGVRRFELTRLDAEDIIQRNRGDIERCISLTQKRYYYLDFLFSFGEDGGLNIDVYPGTELGDEEEIVHPRLIYEGLKDSTPLDLDEKEIKRLYPYKKEKLSFVAPSVNKCIIESINNDFRYYFLDENRPFIHRYIADAFIKGGVLR